MIYKTTGGKKITQQIHVSVAAKINPSLFITFFYKIKGNISNNQARRGSGEVRCKKNFPENTPHQSKKGEGLSFF
jgi:hypothetical protein